MKTESLTKQINILAKFIMETCEGYPNANEGAIDCAIRIIKDHKGELLRSELDHRLDTRRVAIEFCAERSYRISNPDSKMDVPSLVYEITEKAYDKWSIKDKLVQA